jgi:hypothetical protein
MGLFLVSEAEAENLQSKGRTRETHYMALLGRRYRTLVSFTTEHTAFMCIDVFICKLRLPLPVHAWHANGIAGGTAIGNASCLDSASISAFVRQ